MAGDQRVPRRIQVADAVVEALGSFAAIGFAVTALLLWGLTGPLLGFSNTWQLIINTSTTIVTFLMVFVIQNSQNRDSKAMETKLDAILAGLDSLPDELVGIEELPHQDIEKRQRQVRKDVE